MPNADSTLGCGGTITDELCKQARDLAGMNRAGAAEGEQRHAAVIDAAVGGVRARGCRHRLGDDAEDAARRVRRREIELGGERRHRPVGGGAVELHVAAEKVVGVEQAEHEVGVGHRRLRSAAAVAGRAGRGAGAFGTDLEQSQRIGMGDAAAAGADLDHVDRREW